MTVAPFTRKGCHDLDPNWPDSITGKPRGPILCVSYPNCSCGREDAKLVTVADSCNICLMTSDRPPSNARIIELDGKLYLVAVFDLRPRVDVQEMYQRLATRETAPGKKWFGTTLAADHAYEVIQQRRDELARFKEMR